MKKISSFLGLALAASLLFSCSDDDNKTSAPTGVQVVTRATDIDPAGGESSIELDKPVASAYTSGSWLTVTPEGNMVKLAAPQNASVESRHATVVIKASESDSTVVSITQLGAVMSYEGGNIFCGNAGTEVAKYVRHNQPLSIYSAPSWVDAKVDGDSIRINVLANTTDKARGGYVRFKAGALSDSIAVSQADFSQLKGDYIIGGYDISDGSTAFYNCQLYSYGKLFYMSMPRLKWSWDGSFDENTLSFGMYNATWVGTYQSSYYILALLINSKMAISADQTQQGFFQFQVDEDGTIVAVLSYQDEVGGIVFGACTQQNLNTYQGLLTGFMPAMVIKDDGTAEAKARAQRVMARKAPLRSTVLGKMPQYVKWK